MKYLRYTDLLLVEERLRPYFVAEFLKNLGCRAVKEVAAPGDKAAAAAAAAATGGAAAAAGGAGRVRRRQQSEEAREADIVLRDPKASPRRTSARR